MTFRSSLFFRIIISLLASIPWGFFLGLGAYLFSRFTLEFIPCFLVAGLIIFITEFLLLRQNRIIISEQGVEYHHLYYQIRSSWENVSGIAVNRKFPVDRDCLFLKESGIKYSKIWALQVAFFSFTNPAIDRSIPLGRFVFGDWRKTKLGTEIRRCAPFLFDERPNTGSA